MNLLDMLGQAGAVAMRMIQYPLQPEEQINDQIEKYR